MFSENEFADDEQKKGVAEGNILRDIHVGCAEATLAAATPMVAADATWGMTHAGVVNILIACETARAAILVATEIGSSSRGKDDFQLEDKLDMEIEYIRRLMVRMSLKQQTATRKQKDLCTGRTKVDSESIVGGDLQNKVWKPGEDQLKDDEADGKQQNQVWDPRGRDEEHMIRRS